jgi:UDP-N-acetylglucosamine--N-acetylmuramyl-(pentapeptide) pyrophosphoryl-undecaprenol N-acetylglucosamine transferase
MTQPAERATALLVAGGTGGHLYPGIAIARALVKGNTEKGSLTWDAVFAVRLGDIGKSLLEREGFPVVELPGQGMPRAFSMKFFTFPFKVVAGFVQAWKALSRLQPRVVIGMGGYLSFPVLVAARLQGRRTMIHEQNVLPGVSNKVLGRLVDKVAVSFSESAERFPGSKVWVSGLPVRTEIGKIDAAEGRRQFKLAENKVTFLIFGGSLGARQINQAAIGAWTLLGSRTNEFQVLHVTGTRDFDEIKQHYQGLTVQAVVIPYCHDMASALAAADFVVCRAGASTVAELVLARRPALLVPFPFASENHQFYNAEALVRRGVAEIIADQDLTAAKLAERLDLYFKHPERLPQMRQRLEVLAREGLHAQAAERLADYIRGVA